MFFQKGNFFLICILVALCNPIQSLSQRFQDLPLLDSITSYGITWKFTEPVTVGQFVNGEYYVVGTITIQSITPAPANHRNGSVLNLPLDQGKSGFDDRVSSNRYDSTMRANPPFTMNPGDALISTISVDTVGKLPRWLREGNEKTVSPVKSASVLTCLAEAVSADAFRPSYCDRVQKIYYADSLRWDLLPALEKVNTVPDIDEFAGHFQQPWLDVCFFGFDAAVGYQPDYGREVGRAVGMASLMLLLDYTKQEKERMLINLVQYGIDLWGIARAGYPGWQAHGGHGSGRKWPIVFAGIMLDDSEMRAPTVTYPDLKFGEDMQTMYDNCWTGADVVYAGHVGAEGHPDHPGWGAYEHLRPSQWVSDIGESYRRCCTSLCWIGQALAALLMKAKTDWNHDSFFDYCDRWMTEDDSEHVIIILEETGEDYSASWARQRQCWDDFVEEMWAKYRDTISEAIPLDNIAINHNFAVFPNPCRQSATIYFSVQKPSNIEICVYDAAGKLVKNLLKSKKQPGKYHVQWDIKDLQGNQVGCGIYFCTVNIENKVLQKKIMLVK